MERQWSTRLACGEGDTIVANNLLTGPPRYVPRGPWHPPWALVAALVIQAGFQLAAGIVGTLIAAWVTGVPVEELSQQQMLTGMLAFLLISQACVVAAVWYAAGLFGGVRREVLQLDRPGPSAGDLVVAFIGLVVVLGAYNALIYFLSPASFFADMQQFVPMIRDPHGPLTAVAVGGGAPISEELLFRGFLLSALAQWRLGFWPAALMVNAVWTAFHAGYSAAGIMEVFVGGLYLSWLLWRSGSIWLPIICHAVTNITFLSILALYAAR